MGGAPVKAPHVIDAARAAGVTVSIDGDSLLLRSGSPPPREVIDALCRHKNEVIDFLQSDRSVWTAQHWQAFFDERTAIAECEGRLPPREAEARAFSACVVEWLRRNPVRSAPDHCCWCGTGQREGNVLLPFGTECAGHAWMHSACWSPWREQRQAQAVDFLQGLGITVPIEFPIDFGKNGRA
jgi:hypothetical protein